MEPTYIPVIAIGWILLDAILVAGLALLRLRRERHVRRAGQQLVAEVQAYVNAAAVERPTPVDLPRSTASAKRV